MSVSLFIAVMLSSSMMKSTQKVEVERARMIESIGKQFNPHVRDLPFSFRYGGHSFKELVSGWKATSQARDLGRTKDTFTYVRTDPATGLQVRWVATRYKEFPAIEWTVFLKNTGKHDTPIIEDLQALDRDFERGTGSEFLLHHNVGSPANRSDYMPLETILGPMATKHISAAGGRPTNSDMSYFNVSNGKKGTIVVVGWPGQWASDFTRDAGNRLHIKAGQELTHFKLHPGEQVRTPLIVLLDWKGDWIDGQNEWRRWMMAFGMPKPGGNLPKPMFLASSSRAYEEMIGGNEANQIMHIDRYLEEGLKLDYWWMDAGWYVQQHGWPQVGTWEVDKKRFPNGLTPISDHAHANGVKTLVWFEPERVAPDTWLSNNHPEWLLNPLGVLETRNASALGTNEPCVVFNTGENTVSWNGITWKSKSLACHPGPNGEYSVIRWKAPSDGQYNVEATFEGIDEKTTTDFHVLRGTEAMFNGYVNLNGFGRSMRNSGTIWLQAGQSIDFVVGYGNGNYGYDSTGVSAVVTDPSGTKHDAAKEYGKGNWSYGFLSPGARPDASTFKAYDKKRHGGAGGTQLLDLGNPQAWNWLVEHIDNLLKVNHIDLYRQDFNMDPLIFWRSNDAPDRQGITENKHVVGYLAYWDELRRRHPNMLIDSCASGGRRNDLETMRRAVPLWRSDYAYEPIGHQGMTYGLSMWLPYHGTGTVATSGAPYYGGGVSPVEPYAFWSNAAPSLGSGIDIREKAIDYASLRRLFGAWRKTGKFYYGDYYPLTPYSQAEDAWIAWQFNCPSSGDGIIQAFRRAKSGETSLHVALRGLDGKAKYSIQILEGGTNAVSQKASLTGSDLMHGLTIESAEKPGVVVVVYSRLLH